MSTGISTRLTFDADAFDPVSQFPEYSGDGSLIAFSSARITGDENIWILSSSDPGVTEAVIGLEPRNLNEMAHNKWLKANVELPLNLDPANIVHGSVQIMGNISADPTFDEIGDFNNNGIPDRAFRFDRNVVF